jgi:hypothetical protein
MSRLWQSIFSFICKQRLLVEKLPPPKTDTVPPPKTAATEDCAAVVGPRGLPEAAAAAPPPPRPPPPPIPLLPSPPSPPLPPPPPPTATPAAALACQLLARRQASPACPPPPVRPPSAPVRAPCRPTPRQRRRWRRSRHPLRLLPRDSWHTCHMPRRLMPLLLLHGRLWLRRWAWLLEAGVAAGKSQNQEWPFAAVSGCSSRPVVKRALRVVCGGVERASCARSRVVLRVWRRRLPLHSIRRELQGARLHLACHCPRRRRRDRCAAALRLACACALLLTCRHPWPSQVVDCCCMRAALGSWGGV